MSAIPSTTASSILPWLTDLSSQSQGATSPADAILANETNSESESQPGAVPQGNIFATIAALGSLSSGVQQSAGTQESLAGFLGTLEQEGTGAAGSAGATDAGAAGSTSSLSDALSAIAASNDSSSQQAAMAQLFSADGLTPGQLQMDFLTATLESTSTVDQGSTSDLMFPELSQDSGTQSPLNILG